MRETIAVIGEGITEFYYIQSIKDCVKIKPKAFIPKNSGMRELENCIRSCIASGYSKYSTASFGNNELKRLLNERTGYDTSEKFLKANSLHNLFCCKEGDLKRAIDNARKSVVCRENGNPHAGFSEIGELFDYLVLKE